MTNAELISEFEAFGSNVSHMGVGLGGETEQIQRALKAQIMKFLPECTEQLQQFWDKKDKNYAEFTNTSISRIELPKIEKKNYYTGIKPSLLEAPLYMWPSVTVWAHDSKPSSFQADQYDTIDVPIFIAILCHKGPVKQAELHGKEGIEIEQELDSVIQRLSDAVHMCVKKDPTIGNVLAGAIEKPPIATQYMPWSKPQQEGVYIFQGKQLQYTGQKNSF